MALKPKAKPQLTIDIVDKVIAAKKIDRSKFPVCVVAVRGYYQDTMGVKGKNDRGIFDDAAFVRSPSAFVAVNFNTDPSGYRKGRGTGSSKGMASLKEGVWDYKVGSHKGRSPAGVQAGRVTVIRDGIDHNYEDTGYFGINHHWGSSVGTSSLGCQTVPPEQWPSYINPIVSELKRYGKTVYKYILINNAELEEIRSAPVTKPVVVETPKAPEPVKIPTGHENHKYEEPKILMVDVAISAHGSFKTKSGKPLGMVHHYTAGHLSPDHRQVTGMLQSLGKRGLGCMGMDEQGVIYVPKSLGFTKIGYHAGSSKWLGKTSLNQYLLGMEVCNPGKVYAHKGEFFAYWDVDSKRIPRSNAKPLDPDRVREWKTSPGEQHKGFYFAFTDAQEKALINFDLWQKKTNPEFSFDWCVGHDEISQSGKTDPGACLSMPMADFRELLKRLEKKA